MLFQILQFGPDKISSPRKYYINTKATNAYDSAQTNL
jgi:hypothetical protein